MIAAGIVLAAVGDSLVAFGAWIIAETPSGNGLAGLQRLNGILVLASGVAHSAMGIPFIAYGVCEVPVEQTPTPPEATLLFTAAPNGAALTLSF